MKTHLFRTIIHNRPKGRPMIAWLRPAALLLAMVLSMAMLVLDSKAADKDNPLPEKNNPVVLKINNQAVNADAVLAAMNIIAARSGETNRNKLYQRALNDIIEQQLSYELALKDDLEKSSTINNRINDLAVESAQQLALLKKQMIIAAWHDSLPNPTVDDAELQQQYNIWLRRGGGQEVHLAHIVVASEVEAINLIQQIKAGKKFANMARAYSLDKKSAVRGGDIGFVRQGQLPPSLEAVAFSLRRNETTNVPVKSPFGYHLLTMIEKRKMTAPSLAAAKPTLLMMAKEKVARQRILDYAKESTIVVIDKDNRAVPIDFQQELKNNEQ